MSGDAENEVFALGSISQSNPADKEIVAHAVSCNVHCRVDDRLVSVGRPIYEIPLLVRFWRAAGGDCEYEHTWPVGISKFTKSAVYAVNPATPMSREQMRAELRRLAETYRVPLQNGGTRSIFEEVYEKGGALFPKTVHRIYSEYANLMRRAKSENRLLTREDWHHLLSIPEPESMNFDPVDDLFLHTDETSAPIASDENDSSMQVMQGMLQAGFSAEIAGHVASLHSAGTVDARGLAGSSVLHSKPNEIQRVLNAYNKIIKEQASQVPALETVTATE